MGSSWFASYNFKIFCTWSTFSRFLLAWTINFWFQTLSFDDGDSKHQSKICISGSKSRHPCCEKPSKVFFAIWTWLEVAVARPQHQTTSTLLLKEFYQKLYFLLLSLTLVLSSLEMVSLALPGNSNHCLSSNCWHMMHGVRVTAALFFVAVWELLQLFVQDLERAWLRGLVWHLSYEWLVCLPWRGQSLKPLSLHLGRLFFLSCLLLLWLQSLQSLCCSYWPCWRWW